MDVLYRYEEVLHKGGYVQVALQTFPITKKIPKGFWIDNFGVPRFVLSGAHKHFACLTKDEALESFMARKVRQIKILAAQYENTRQALSIAERVQARGKDEGPTNLLQNHRKVLLPG